MFGRVLYSNYNKNRFCRKYCELYKLIINQEYYTNITGSLQICNFASGLLIFLTR